MSICRLNFIWILAVCGHIPGVNGLISKKKTKTIKQIRRFHHFFPEILSNGFQLKRSYNMNLRWIFFVNLKIGMLKCKIQGWKTIVETFKIKSLNFKHCNNDIEPVLWLSSSKFQFTTHFYWLNPNDNELANVFMCLLERWTQQHILCALGRSLFLCVCVALYLEIVIWSVKYVDRFVDETIHLFQI